MPRRDHSFDHIRTILDAVRLAADPFASVAAAVRLDRPGFKRPAIIAIGKAAPRMYAGLLDALPGEHESIMVVPDGVDAPPWAIRAGHPVPTLRSMYAAERVRGFVTNIATGQAGHDGFIMLISGGASSLLTLPLPGIDFDRYAQAVAELLRWGVDIHTLNTIRKHCEQLKAGRLAVLMQPLPCRNFILSDVIGDDLSTVASGPTVGDPTTWDDARDLIEHRLEFSLAAPLVWRHVGETSETPKPGEPILDHIRSRVVGSNQLAVEAAADAARRIGFDSHETTQVTGDAAETGRRLASQAAPAVPGTAHIFGGETTVDASGSSGIGGRNQELALAAAVAIDGRLDITVAACATDGVDGPTDAAGAIVTGDTCRHARSMGLDPEQSLHNHDSFRFFSTLDRTIPAFPHPHLIRTGPTGTNVNDVAIALVY